MTTKKPGIAKAGDSTPALASLPTEIADLGASLPEVLLPYQRALLADTAAHQVVICEKSRRIGMTWGVAADAVLTAGSDKSAGGMDVFYVGYNLDMTREFVDTCAMWGRAFAGAAAEVEEFLFREQDEKGADRAIQAFRIRFASSFEITALCSRPRSLRGRQGYVIIDEAAFHDELAELLKAALALLIWGGKVLVISTHDGVDNPFAALVNECRAGKRPKYKLTRTTFDDALRDGLYRRVCLVSGKEYSAENEREWAEGIRALYGDDATEELDCIPKQSGGRYLARSLLEARATDAPVVRYELEEAFVDKSEDERIAIVETFCVEHLAPLLAQLTSSGCSFIGQDFGRSGDLSVVWPLVLEQDLHRHTPFVVELRNVPFKAQEQILFWLIDRLPRFSGAALDARGNGQYLAEVTRQKCGPDSVAQVMLSEGWYRENMPRLKSALEDGFFDIPRDADVIDDLRALEVVNGVARLPEKSHTKGRDGKQRHGDSAIAAALAEFASHTLDGGGPIEFSTSGSHTSLGAFAGDPDGGSRNFAGWND
jgi:phage FluMu gp28-like protein